MTYGRDYGAGAEGRTLRLKNWVLVGAHIFVLVIGKKIPQ